MRPHEKANIVGDNGNLPPNLSYTFAWSLSKTRDMKVTLRSLKKSLVYSSDKAQYLISDNGNENTGRFPRKLIVERGIKQLIAKKDIKYSNSMVEVVFRQLKQKFYVKRSRSYSGLYSKIKKFVYLYNEVIPHSSFKGATPIETYNDEFDQNKFDLKNKLNYHLLIKKRYDDYNKCNRCFN